jgi:DNA-binding transcriptional regulator LsrR (DeoR family)
MPQQRMDIRMIKDILRLKYQGGLSHEAIARSLAISVGAGLNLSSFSRSEHACSS